MNYKNLIVDSDGAITIITLDRPDRLNAIDRDILNSLDSAISALAKEESCRAIIITGAGRKSFCTGADIGYLKSLKNKRDAAEFADKVHSVFNKIENLEKIVIAAVNGYCLGGGCELAMACDIRIASSNSVFGQPEVKLGILPGGGGTYRLSALVGIGKAKEMILSGDIVNSDSALEMGLVNRVVELNSLMKDSKSLALKISHNSFNAVKNAKLAINANLERNDAVEKRAFLMCFEHPDRVEGINAFTEHRKAKFE
jgi:enoyl-CoA hydratase